MGEGEKLEDERTIHQLSQLRSYVIGALTSLMGVSFLAIGVTAGYPVVALFVAVYLVYTSNLQDAGKMAKSALTAALTLFGIFLTTSFLSDISQNLQSIGKRIQSLATGRANTERKDILAAFALRAIYPMCTSDVD